MNKNSKIKNFHVAELLLLLQEKTIQIELNIKLALADISQLAQMKV